MARSQPWAGHEGVRLNDESKRPSSAAPMTVPAVASRRGPAVGARWVAVGYPEQEDEPRIEEGAEDSEQDPLSRIAAVGIGSSRPETRTTPRNTMGATRRASREGCSFRMIHAATGTTHYLDVGDDGGEPGTDEVDGVMPCSEVGGEKKPGGDGNEASPRRAFVPVPHQQPEHEQDGDGVGSSKEGGRGRRHIGLHHQYRTPRDREDSCESDQSRHRIHPLGNRWRRGPVTSGRRLAESTADLVTRGMVGRVLFTKFRRTETPNGVTADVAHSPRMVGGPNLH